MVLYDRYNDIRAYTLSILKSQFRVILVFNKIDIAQIKAILYLKKFKILHFFKLNYYQSYKR